MSEAEKKWRERADKDCKSFIHGICDTYHMGREAYKAALRREIENPSSQCMANEWKDGYCKRHHPEECRRKQAERDAKKEAYRLAFENQDNDTNHQKG